MIDRNTSRVTGYNPGLLSGLVCAGANASPGRGSPAHDDGEPARDDGYLTAEEIGWLDLSNAQLVVLSACETGLGESKSGEGLIGLRRAIMGSGARTVISSLWTIPDDSTKVLMKSYYTNLWSNGMGPERALRAAQLSMLKENRRVNGKPRPSAWGAFVLDGDWR